MMKHHPHTSLLAIACLLLARAAIAASVFPAAATNYIFATPLFPATIRGEVMGIPPAYYVPRGEDYDWLVEAYTERDRLRAGFMRSTDTVLAPEFGKWALGETNRFNRWVTAVDAAGVTNVVVGYNLVTNAPASTGRNAWYGRPVFPDYLNGAFWNPYGSRTGYLDPFAPLTTQARVVDGLIGGTFTNIVSYVILTNGFTNGFSIIEFPMTNGTVSVHTNKWRAEKSFASTVTYTSVTDRVYLDFCHSGDGPFPGYTNAPPLAGQVHEVRAALSNAYESLRGATRLAEGDADSGVSPTNSEPASVEVRYYMGESVSCTTNAPSSFSGDYKSVYEVEGEHYRILWDYDEVTGAPIYKWFYGSYEKRTIPDRHNVTLRTRFDSDVATAGGVQRVTVEAAFVIANVLYFRSTNYEMIVDINEAVVVPIAAPQLLESNSGKVYLTLSVDVTNLAVTAFAAAGAPAPPQNVAEFIPAKGHLESWAAELRNFMVIYRTHPTSKFADWQSQ